MTFTTVLGLSPSCVRFVGIISLPVSEHGKVLPSHLSDGMPEEELFLVIERASEGNILDFLERKLASADDAESWKIVVEVLSSIATGVTHLHGSGIIHGYVPLQMYTLSGYSLS
jgi:serine/threonine protein kinase